MPGLGTPFNSFILPYPIRVDAFTSVPNDSLQPKLYLLTHTHSDHITGLQAKSFAETVWCSADAKPMLLRHQAYGERALTSAGMRVEPQRTYAHLKKDPMKGINGEVYYEGSRDLLQCLRPNERTRFELDASENGEIWITAFDANHCPGSLMYVLCFVFFAIVKN
jgi:Cft2 family RNA processing exonuclease